MTEFETTITTVLAELERALRSVDPQSVTALVQAILQSRRIFIAGKGRSGLQMRAFAMRLMHMGLTVHVVDEVTTPALGASDLLLVGSSSGQTASVVEYAKRAQSLGSRVVLITSAASSPVAERASIIVRIEAPPATGSDPALRHTIQPMGSLFEQTLGVLLDIVVLQLMAAQNLTSDQMHRRHANLE